MDYNESVEGEYDGQAVTLEDRHGEVLEEEVYDCVCPTFDLATQYHYDYCPKFEDYSNSSSTAYGL